MLSVVIGLVTFTSGFCLAHAAEKSATAIPDGNRIVIETPPAPPPVPVFFSANVDETVHVSPAEIAGTLHLKLHLVQGHPDVLTLGLTGDGEVTEVSGRFLRDWSVRRGADATRRFLDLRLDAITQLASSPADFDLTVKTRLNAPTIPGATAVLLAAPGEAVGFASHVSLQADPALDLRVTAAPGMTPLADAPDTFATAGEGGIRISITPKGAAAADAELAGAQLTGQVNETAGSVAFHLRGQLVARKAGARLRLLSGRAALDEHAAGDGWHAELIPLEGGRFAYDLVAERAGTLPLDLTFAAVVREEGDWRTLDFAMPAGAVVPLRLEGLGDGVSFRPDAPVVPAATPQGWQGFLPAGGEAALAWKHARAATEAALFFSSSEQTEVRIGAGLLRQMAQLTFRILQGKLGSVRVRLDGPGEILGVEGANVTGWKVATENGARFLDVRFSRPVETGSALVVTSQTELGNWPVTAEPLRFTPENAVRHSGFVRVANRGAVRLEVADATGLMQLAPAQYPGPAAEAGTRQVFVYRFASANYGYKVLATRIQPEVAVSAITTYRLADNARVIEAALELDIREAPLRDWSLRIPDGYAVTGVTGADLADYVTGTEVTDGYRPLRLLFARELEGRELVQLRLEKNEAAAAGAWALPPLRFPEAKSVRGHVGAIATAGYRLAPAQVDQLTEVPLSYFPAQTPGLQQAWRLRDPAWTAELRIEALGQSVQADVFHLYSLKEGLVRGSVLLNYFVVGAPASEWRIEVPESAGNIDVVGQNVRHDWRREGNQLIVSLHQPVLGAATLLVTFDQPMSARGGAIQPGQVRPLGVQAERGFVQVVSPLQVKFDVRRADGGLLKLEPGELPAEFRLLGNAPSLAVYQYTARPFALEMNVEWYAPGETVDQVIDFARLSSQVSRDGQGVTEAEFFVRTRGRKDLRLILPPGAKLWEVRVDRELVNARADGDQTLVPLPARLNPNEPVAVALRLGQPATGDGSHLRLVAPRAVAATTVIDEWTVHGDHEKQLVPRGGTATPVAPVLTETGFEWIEARGGVQTFVLLTLLGGAIALLGATGTTGPRVTAGLILCAVIAACAVVLAGIASMEVRRNLAEIQFASTMVGAGEDVSIDLDNVSPLRATLVGWGIIATVAGAGVWLASFMGAVRTHRTAPALRPGGVVLAGAGLLAQHGGAPVFFLALALVTMLGIFLPALVRWRQIRREDVPPDAEPGAGPAATVLPLLLILGAIVLASGPHLQAQTARPRTRATSPAAGNINRNGIEKTTTPSPAGAPAVAADGTRPAQTLVQHWILRDKRLFAEAEITVRGGPGDSFLLLREPAVLTDFRGDGLRVGKIERGGHAAYYLAPERDGVLTAHVKYELAVPDCTQPVVLPTGPAAAQRVTIELDQGGWEIASAAAVEVLPTAGLGDDRSGATLVLAPGAAPAITFQPKHRDPGAEKTVFFAESANLYVPGPGVVNGLTRVTVRPAQGRVAALDLIVPAELTVGDVSRGPVGAWRFDPQTHRLHIAIEPAQTDAFAFTVETQLVAGELPFAVGLEPLRVTEAASDTGLLALAFPGDAQPDSVRAAGLSAVNLQDFDASLLPHTAQGAPLAALQNVWRYGATGGRVELKVAPVAPEVRVTGRQVLSLDDDRLVMADELHVAITRVGLFKLSFVLPEGLEIEALSGTALSDWTEAQENGQRVITLHLNGRTLGEQTFNLSLAGAAPRPQDAWAVPHVAIREATRQTGDVVIVPGRGLRLRAGARDNVTQLDPRDVGAEQPGSLAFRLLQQDWTLRLGLEALEPWITVQALQEVTLREGQTLTRLGLRYRVENAAVKQLRLRLPGLGDERARTVHATGAAVSDFARVPDAADTWEIRFQHAIAGETDVQVEFQGLAAREQGAETVVTPEFPGARQIEQFVAIRSGGRLELDVSTLPRGWSRVDWSAVPAPLQSRTDRSVPVFCYRVAEPERGLAVNVRRHEVADALKLRVTSGELLTLCSPDGAFLTAVDLKVDVLEKSTLRVTLPGGARLFSTFVNGESVSTVREGAAYLFHVTPNTDADRTAAVRLVYAVGGPERGAVGLVGPSLSIPLENVKWRVVIPPGYDLARYRGALRLEDRAAGGFFGLDQYRAIVSSRRTAEAQRAVTLLREANTLLQRGEQEKAGEALSRVSGSQALDAASNEDARVQLRTMKTQQAMLGLNTRRQRLYLDNRLDAARNDLLEQAANQNPFMQGKLNFDPRQMDQFLMGNTAEENTALRGIASRLVDQQLTAEPAPGAIDVAVPERGQVLTFSRTLQVDGSAPLALTLTLEKTARTTPLAGALIVLGLAAIAALQIVQKRSEV